MGVSWGCRPSGYCQELRGSSFGSHMETRGKALSLPEVGYGIRVPYLKAGLPKASTSTEV